MYSDSEPLESLNLSVRYVSSWTWLQGFRQLYQNFMDACIEKYSDFRILKKSTIGSTILFQQAKRTGNKVETKDNNFISYNPNKDGGQLIFQNEKSFPIKCLLMGCSDKGPQALGQFGQGMKLSMMIILKAGMEIIIESGDKIYYPTLKSWDHSQHFIGKYDQNVLYVKVSPKPFQDKTRVVINKISQDKFTQFLYISLSLLDQSKYQKITCGSSTLIITDDIKLRGKVFKKGVRLQLHQSPNSQKFQHYSYDFDLIQVGRDRDCVNNVWDLYKLQSKLHYDVSCKLLDQNFLSNNPHFKPLLRAHLENVYSYLITNNYQTHFFHSYSIGNKPLCDLYYDKFLEKNGSPQQLYPQYDSVKVTISTNLIKYGLQKTFYEAVDVSWEQWHTLSHSNKYKSIETKINDEIIKKSIRELNKDQQQMMKMIILKIGSLFPQIAEYQLKIKEFNELVCCKEQSGQQKIFYLNPKEISNQDKMIRNIAKALLQ